MKFNKYWTKSDNDLMLKMIKEGKTPIEIRYFFGNDKLFYHPNKKYYDSGKSASIPTIKNKISNFEQHINEIIYNELKTDFIKDWNRSEHFPSEFNYNYTFQTNLGNRYVLDFIYLKDSIGLFKDKDLYNVSFTLEKQRNLKNYKEYEKDTGLKEHHELIKRIIFIFKDFHSNYGKNCIYLLGQTENKQKILWYRNIIKSSFSKIKETIDISSFTNGLPAYYFEIINI